MADDDKTKDTDSYKVKDLGQGGGSSAFGKYRALCYGDVPFWKVLRSELLMLLFGYLPGALGLGLRGLFFPCLFGACGRKVVFGRDLTLRHAHKIRLGDGVIVDDHAVLDAKGEGNTGIAIGDGVYIGRNTIVYCKGGDITIGDRANLSSNCQVFSSNSLTLGSDTVVGAFTYLLSGGSYDYTDARKFSEQSGMETRGPLTIGPNGWLSARVTVVDGASIGEHCVIGAGAVVTTPIPAHSVAVGVPAKVVKAIDA